jgi:hypothetical protein
MRHLLRAATVGLIGFVALAGAGCAGTVKNMREVESVNTAPAPSEAVVVFIRPSGMAYGVQSVVCEVPDGQRARLVGIVAAKKKVAYRLPAGMHTFMVLGESADFMEARLAAGKTYYALVTPRPGVWKARFSLRPIHVSESGDLQKWQRDTRWTEVDDSSAEWAAANASDIESQRAKYMAEWLRKSVNDRPVMFPEDGL